MRQGQQNRRGRGRNNNNNNNNRKSQNPLTRSFESTGPDVKLRGTPSHIAEKYVSLARDALSSGDPVLAENYLQHAEHYNRIILSFREQQMSQGGVDPFSNGAMRTHTLASGDGGDGEEFSEDEGGEDLGGQPQPQVGQGGEGQPQGFQQPQQRNFDSQQRFDNRPRPDNYNRDNRGEHRNNQRFDRGDRQDFRGPRPDGPRPDRGDRYRDDRRQQGGGQHDHDNGGNGFRRRDRYQGNSNGSPVPEVDTAPPVQPVVAERATVPPAPLPPEQEQPAFLRRPVRRPRREENAEAATAAPVRPATEDQE